MGRPKGSKNKQISDEGKEIEREESENVTTLPVVRVERFEGEPTAKKESVQPLSDAQREQLFHHHSKTYAKTLAAKKTADANFKNVCKLAKSEMGADAVFRIKLGAMLESQEGEEEKKDELAATIEVAAWVGSSIGTQLRMFDDADGVPLGMRAYDDGRRTGLKGNPAKPPSQFSSGEPMQQWLHGHSDGNGELASKSFKSFKDVADEGDAVVRDANAGNKPSYQVVN